MSKLRISSFAAFGKLSAVQSKIFLNKIDFIFDNQDLWSLALTGDEEGFYELLDVYQLSDRKDIFIEELKDTNLDNNLINEIDFCYNLIKKTKELLPDFQELIDMSFNIKIICSVSDKKQNDYTYILSISKFEFFTFDDMSDIFEILNNIKHRHKFSLNDVDNSIIQIEID